MVLRMDGRRPVLLTSPAETQHLPGKGTWGSSARRQDESLGVIAAAAVGVGLQEEQGGGGCEVGREVHGAGWQCSRLW